MRPSCLAWAALAVAVLLPLPGHAQADPAPAAARVVVKYRADTATARKFAQAAGAQAQPQGVPGERMQALAQRAGMALRAGPSLADRTQVVLAAGIDSAALAARLAQDGDVEYAVPDRRKRLSAVPNDPLFLPSAPPANGPASGQWYLRAPDATVVSAINAAAAWDVTTGSTGVVVAVLDTGVRFDHPELQKVAAGGNLLDGYDMVTDVATANDGDGRDADASDPGDWITLAETTQVGGKFEGCSVDDFGRPVRSDSSWHGTQTAGLIGAATGNGVGMASVGRNVRVLPVRVLGKCGGLDSDITAGMLWAAGIDVPGVPHNNNPAKVINMSLGGSGACSALYADVVRQVLAKGVVIVASAGNTTGKAVEEPGDCAGVIGVAAIRHVGTKVGFSSIGPEVSISAPGGNCINTAQGSPCLYPILTTLNTGTLAPVADSAGGSTYSDSFDISVGTSFSAPLVAGTAALMLSTAPNLSTTQVLGFLKSTARAFPTTGADPGIPQCQLPSSSTQDQCYCTTQTCGAGMLDAAAAVLAAQAVAPALPQPQVGVQPQSPVSGDVVSLDGAGSYVSKGRSAVSYAWTLVNGGGIVTALTASGTTATAKPSGAGSFTVSLTVTDSTGAVSAATQTTVQVAGSSSSSSSADAGGGGGGALGLGWLAALASAVLALVLTRGRAA